MENNNDDLRKEKEVQYYTSIVNAWFNTRLEKDKSLLTLSAAAIGLLITLLTTIGANSTDRVILYGLAIISFIICLCAVIIIFQRNSDHLEKVAKKESTTDPYLKLLDKIASYTFVLGIIFSMVIGISAGIENLNNKGDIKMTDKKSTTTNQSTTRNGNFVEGQRSFVGISGLDPSGSSNSGSQSSSSSGGQSSNSGSGNSSEK